MHSVWFFVGAVALGIVEIFTLDLTLLMLAGGALAGGVAGLLGAEAWLSAVIAMLVATLLLFALRPFLLRSLRARQSLVETNAAALVGKQAIAVTDVTDTKGRVKLAGEVWSARLDEGSAAVEEGATVTVVKIAGATAVVAAQQQAAKATPKAPKASK